MAPLSVCLAGLGAWGACYAKLLAASRPPLDLFFASRDPVRLARFAARYRAKGTFPSWEQAVDDPRVQAILLVLPHCLHAPAAIRAAQAGKHVFVEKPIATTLPDAQAMIDAARHANTVLMAAEDFAFRPDIQDARRRLPDPAYFSGHGGGRYQPSGWRADPTLSGGGILMDHGSHLIRAMRLLMGEPHRVFATITSPPIEHTTELLFQAPGWQAHIYLSWNAPAGPLPDIILSNSKGELHLSPRSPLFPWRARAHDPYRLQLDEFLSAVRHQRQPSPGPEQALNDLGWILNAYWSANTGTWFTPTDSVA